MAEKYLQLARDAQSSGDPVGAESYLQHAEHYFRLIATYQQTQQVGYNRQLDDADDGDDEDSGLPDRFASPQAPAPFVPQQPQPQSQPQPSPYAGDRQQPAYADRSQGGERPSYGERNNGYGQRQDRNGQNGQRRPYRDDRPYENRNNGENRNGEFRANTDRRNGYERMQERAQQQERFNSERGYRDAQPEQPREAYTGEQPRSAEQPRIEQPRIEQPRIERSEAEQPIARTEPLYRPDPPVRSVPEDGPGLPSFITTPTRVVTPEPVAQPISEPPAAGSPFPGDVAVDSPKFPRRRRRTVRSAAIEGDDVPAEQPTGD